jgi:hypothetical protein
MYYPDEDLVVVMLVNTAGNLSPGALATEMVDVLLPRPATERKRFTGDAAPLVGSYSGPARGRPLTLTVTVSGTGLAVVAEGDRPAPLSWIDDWTFRRGATQILTFERAGSEGTATIMRVDDIGSHYVLRRK